MLFSEKKRRIYDQYGKEGLIDHNEGMGGHHHRRRPRDPFDAHDFIFGSGFPFVFRDPEEVFREFFGGSPFDDFFNQTAHHSRRSHQNGNAGSSSRHHHHHRPAHPSNVMSPFLSFSLMDDMFSNPFNMHSSGFTSLSTFNGVHGGGGGGGGMGGNVKRISTSTSFNNGRKVTTKK